MRSEKASITNENLRLAIENNQGIVLYRSPGDSVFHFISGSIQKIAQIELSEDDRFIISPFDETQESVVSINAEEQAILEELNGLSLPRHALPTEITVQDKQENDFISLVNSAVSNIKNNEFQKVVTSRYSTQRLHENFEALRFLQKLSNAYPEGFCYFLLIPGEMCWMGATPELLASRDKNGVVKTVALAGTMPINHEELNLNWTQKEKEEQEYVSEYIEEILKENRIKEYQTKGPQVIQTGKLKHLQTQFEVKSAISSAQFQSLVQDLHPTPAVCGLPKAAALNFIQKSEGYKRSYYSGFIGRLEANGEALLFVNLRCMQLFKNKAILYAGAGITSESNPQKELEETERKMDALRRIINA